MRELIFFILFFSSLSNFASSVSGVAKDYIAEPIKLIFYTDLFSQQPILVGESVVANDGSFSFEYDVQETRLIAIKIKDYRSNFYVAPNSNYSVQLGKFDPLSAPPLSKDKYLPAKLINEDDDKINNAIGLLNVSLDSFEQKHYKAFLNHKAKPAVQGFILVLTKNTLYDKNKFFRKYTDAVIGSLLYKAQYTFKEVYEKSLVIPVDYQNVGYTNLVTDFYNKWFNRYSLTKENEQLKTAIATSNYGDLSTFLATNDFLKNDTLREIIIVRELFRLALNDNTTDPIAVDKMLVAISTTGKTRENKQIAKYYLGRLRKLGIGAEAPNFILSNKDGEMVQLKDFRGKYVYLDFWATWCKPCIKSMQVMKQIHPKYQDNIEFISVNIDERKKRFDKHMEVFSYPWTVLYAGSNEKIKDNYDIVVIPLYYLIDPNGKLIQSPAFSPGGGIEATFSKLFNSETKEEIKIWDWNFDPKNKDK